MLGGEPARTLNWLSALAGAAACGAVTWFCARLTGSLAAAAAGGLLLAGSYTFWTQAVIGEVYTLHLLLTALVLSALLWWSERPSLGRLALVYGVYALGFGNHLMMILLAPAIVVFIAVTPGGLRQVLSPRGLALAAACAAAGASQYLWNASFLWRYGGFPPPLEAWRTFWYDVTKADWRATMVMGVHESALTARRAMYWFDVRQQIGLAGIALAVLGAADLLRRPRPFLLLATAGLTAFAFAYTYNVGDVHVFFLPSHQVLVVFAAAGGAALVRAAGRTRRTWATALAASLVLALPLWRIFDTFPAVDRSGDRRPLERLDAMTRGLGADTLLVADVNWQLDNGLDYYTRHVRPELNHIRVHDAPLTLPFLVRDNLAGGREVVMTAESRALAEAAYGSLFRFERDDRAPARPLPDRLRDAAGREPELLYVVAVLAPYPDLPFDAEELDASVRQLTGGSASLGRTPSYQVLAGRVGSPPLLDRRGFRPFRERLALGSVQLDIRMESWLPADTMRRAGFGRVIAGRTPVLTLERGVSAVLLTPEGAPRAVEYASGLFAPSPRYRVELAAPLRDW